MSPQEADQASYDSSNSADTPLVTYEEQKDALKSADGTIAGYEKQNERKWEEKRHEDWQDWAQKYEDRVQKKIAQSPGRTEADIRNEVWGQLRLEMVRKWADGIIAAYEEKGVKEMPLFELLGSAKAGKMDSFLITNFYRNYCGDGGITKLMNKLISECKKQQKTSQDLRKAISDSRPMLIAIFGSDALELACIVIPAELHITSDLEGKKIEEEVQAELQPAQNLSGEDAAALSPIALASSPVPPEDEQQEIGLPPMPAQGSLEPSMPSRAPGRPSAPAAGHPTGLLARFRKQDAASGQQVDAGGAWQPDQQPGAAGLQIADLAYVPEGAQSFADVIVCVEQAFDHRNGGEIVRFQVKRETLLALLMPEKGITIKQKGQTVKVFIRVDQSGIASAADGNVLQLIGLHIRTQGAVEVNELLGAMDFGQCGDDISISSDQEVLLSERIRHMPIKVNAFKGIGQAFEGSVRNAMGEKLRSFAIDPRGLLNEELQKPREDDGLVLDFIPEIRGIHINDDDTVSLDIMKREKLQPKKRKGWFG